MSWLNYNKYKAKILTRQRTSNVILVFMAVAFYRIVCVWAGEAGGVGGVGELPVSRVRLEFETNSENLFFYCNKCETADISLQVLSI